MGNAILAEPRQDARDGGRRAADCLAEFRRLTPLQQHQLLAFMQEIVGGLGVAAAAQRLAERWQCPVGEVAERIRALLGAGLSAF